MTIEQYLDSINKRYRLDNPDLDGQKKTGNKEQFDRYKAFLDNLMFTDYLSFHLYHDGEFTLAGSDL